MKLIYICLLLLVIPNISALQIGISPERIKINTSLNEQVCKNITLYGEKEFIFETYSLWNKKESKDPADYKTTPEEIGIEVYYEQIRGLKPEQICLKASKPGKYYGMIFHKVVGQNLGAIMPVQIEAKKDSGETYNIISAKVTQNIESKNVELNLFLALIILLLFIFLLKLVYKRSFSNISIE